MMKRMKTKHPLFSAEARGEKNLPSRGDQRQNPRFPSPKANSQSNKESNQKTNNYHNNNFYSKKTRF